MEKPLSPLMAMITIVVIAASPAYGAADLRVCDHTSDEIEQITEKTVSALRAKNYRVIEGEFKVINSSGFGANPGNPYVGYFHPGAVQSKIPSFLLRPKDAVLFVGCTPSAADYFSWRSYAFNQGREVVFASLGDSLNNLVINTTTPTINSLAHPPTSTQFRSGFNHDSAGRTVAVVTAADSATFNVISADLQRSGLASTSHNLDAIPSSKLKNMATTGFVMLHRASVWTNTSAEAEYFKQTQKIFFIEPPSGILPQPLLPETLRKVGDGINESDMTDVVNNIRLAAEGVGSEMANSNYNLVSVTDVVDKSLDGFDCLVSGADCLGDNRDTRYLMFGDSEFSPTDVYVAIGTNSVKTGKSTYTNFGIYNGNKSTNLTANDRDCNGSASPYGINDSRIIVYKFRRNCNGDAYCLDVPTTSVPLDHPWRIVYRTVLEPQTATGNKLSELVLPQIYHFSERSPLDTMHE
eukprot:m.113645 g.113645  ORF g.113645 m.113645 type:complete len:466 (-) comp28285_c1_seq3:336-1733(-)